MHLPCMSEVRLHHLMNAPGADAVVLQEEASTSVVVAQVERGRLEVKEARRIRPGLFDLRATGHAG